MIKTILITGAGSGIGRESAIALAKRGHNVIATTKTDEQGRELKIYASEKGCKLEIFTLDITNEKDAEKIRDLQIDVLLNNAGIGETGPLAEIPMERLRDVFETNVFGTIALSQIALRGMMQRKRGSVIIVSSIAGRIPLPFLAPYGMTKFALSAGAAAMRKEVSRVEANVHVALVEPGAYATGFNELMMAKKYEWLNEGSKYFKILPSLQKDDARFASAQTKSINSIVRQVVKAVEADKPKLRYGAPWWQSWGGELLRIFRG